MALRTVAPTADEKQVKASWNRISWIGRKSGRLTVVQCAGKRLGKYPAWLWVCKCECGRKIVTTSDSLRSGKTFSCGCLKREQGQSSAIHGKSQSAEYKIWCGIKRRCNCPQVAAYKNYGGRGIVMCDRWSKSFSDFFDDVGPRPGNDYSIDRIDNDGNYEPSNVRWATRKQQSRNRRSNHRLTIDGVTKTVTEWSEVHGVVSWYAILTRIHSGWEPIDAISLPKHTKYRMVLRARQSASTTQASN
jgi:hypothetical protein